MAKEAAKCDRHKSEKNSLSSECKSQIEGSDSNVKKKKERKCGNWRSVGHTAPHCPEPRRK